MTSEPEVVTLHAFHAAVIRLNIPRDQVVEHIEPAIHEVLAALGHAGLQPIGPMLAYHLSLSDTHFDFEVGFPINGDLTEAGRVRPVTIPAVTALKTVHTGPYEGLYQAWQRFGKAFKVRYPEGNASKQFREEYRVGPETTLDASKWQTDLFIPLE